MGGRESGRDGGQEGVSERARARGWEEGRVGGWGASVFFSCVPCVPLSCMASA